MLVSTFMYDMALDGTQNISENDISSVQIHNSTSGSKTMKEVLP